MKNKNVAALLAIFFGAFGVHKFYLRDPGSGIFYIMLTIFSASLRFPIGSILGWIDAFTLFTMSEERFNKKYNNNPISRQRRRDQRTQRRTTVRNPYENQRIRRQPEANDYENQRRKKIVRANPFKNSGIKRLKEFDLDLAEVDLKRALEIEGRDQEIHISLAKLYSMEEKTDLAFFHITEAIKYGYTNLEEIKTDDAFAYIRVQESYDDFEQSGFQRVPSTVEASGRHQNAPIRQAIEPPKDDLLQDDVLLSQLNKLKELRSKGLLSEKEFNEEKVKLMGR